MKTEQIEKTVQHLSRSFRQATRGKGIGLKQGTDSQQQMYNWQVEFAYMIDDIQRGPVWNLPKKISDTNKFIQTIRQTTS